METQVKADRARPLQGPAAEARDLLGVRAAQSKRARCKVRLYEAQEIDDGGCECPCELRSRLRVCSKPSLMLSAYKPKHAEHKESAHDLVEVHIDVLHARAIANS